MRMVRVGVCSNKSGIESSRIFTVGACGRVGDLCGRFDSDHKPNEASVSQCRGVPLGIPHSDPPVTPPLSPDSRGPVTVVLIGPPGSGKGTQAVRIAERYRIPHISTGDILRAAVKAGSELGKQVATTLATGGLVDDGLMTDLVRSRLAQPDVLRGFLLDGFPRTVGQAQALDELLAGAPLIVALISVPDEAIVRRLGSRRVCESCSI